MLHNDVIKTHLSAVLDYKVLTSHFSLKMKKNPLFDLKVVPEAAICMFIMFMFPRGDKLSAYEVMHVISEG